MSEMETAVEDLQWDIEKLRKREQKLNKHLAEALEQVSFSFISEIIRLQFSCNVFLLKSIVIIVVICVICISISTSFDKGNCTAGYYATNLAASFKVVPVKHTVV